MVEGMHEAFDFRFREELPDGATDVVSQAVTNFLRTFRFVVESRDFHDDVGTKTEFHQVRRKQRRHVVLVLQAEFRNTAYSSNDSLVQGV